MSLKYITIQELQSISRNSLILLLIKRIGDIPNKEEELYNELNDIYINHKEYNISHYGLKMAVGGRSFIDLFMNDYVVSYKLVKAIHKLQPYLPFDELGLCYPNLFDTINFYDKDFRTRAFSVSRVVLKKDSKEHLKIRQHTHLDEIFIGDNVIYDVSNIIRVSSINIKKLLKSEKFTLFKKNYKKWDSVLTDFDITPDNVLRLIVHYSDMLNKNLITTQDVKDFMLYIIQKKDFDFMKVFTYPVYDHSSKIVFNIFFKELFELKRNEFYRYMNRTFRNSNLPDILSTLDDDTISKLDFTNEVRFYTKNQYKLLIRRRPILLKTASEMIIKSLSLSDWRPILRHDVRHGMILLKYKTRIDTYDKILKEFPKLKLEILYVE
jgi:hypothetical protein